MIKSFIILYLLVMNQALFAQYEMHSLAIPYEEISNPISLNNKSIWNENDIYQINFGFDFQILDQKFSSLSVRAGGGLNFPGVGLKELYVFHVPAGGYLLKDKGTTASLSSIGYNIQGEAGQKILKIQWKNAGFRQTNPNPPDPGNFVDFQIWLFEEDSHLEIHFGDNNIDQEYYGGPSGPTVSFRFDLCSDIFGIMGPADLPSYWFYDVCGPNYSNIDGTPSLGTTYSIERVMTSYSDLPNSGISVYPNPTIDFITVQLENPQFYQLRIVDVLGVLRITAYSSHPTGLKIDLSELESGLYFMVGTSKSGEVLFNYKITKCHS